MLPAGKAVYRAEAPEARQMAHVTRTERKELFTPKPALSKDILQDWRERQVSSEEGKVRGVSPAGPC